jgi:hypothetical protein
MNEEILLAAEKIEERLLDMRAALHRNDAEAVLREVQKMNLYVQDLLLKAHKNRVRVVEKKREDDQGSPNNPEGT